MDRYDVVLLFEDAVGGSFVGSPFSRCSCEAGRLFCSHMRGMVELLILAQMVGTEIKSILRKPIEEIREPVSLDLYTEHYYRKKEDKAKKELLKSVKKRLVPEFDAVASDGDSEFDAAGDDESVEEATGDKVSAQGRRKRGDRFDRSAEVCQRSS